MTSITYTGRHTSGVTIDIDGVNTHVARGASVDVPAKVATALAKSGEWEKADKPTTPEKKDD